VNCRRWIFWVSLFGFFLVSTPPAFAIVNVLPKLEQQKDSWGIDWTSSLTHLDGNVPFFQVTSQFDGYLSSGKHMWIFSAKGAYATTFGDVYLHRYFEHLRYRWFYDSGFGYEGFIQHEYTKAKELKFRGLVGGGCFWRWSGDNVSGSWGIDYFTELEIKEGDDFAIVAEDAVANPDRSGNLNHRLSSYLKLRFVLAENLTVNGAIYVQPRIRDFSDTRILNENGLSIAFTRWFSIKNSLVMAYDFRPFEGREKLDTTLNMSFVFSFGSQPS